MTYFLPAVLLREIYPSFQQTAAVGYRPSKVSRFALRCQTQGWNDLFFNPLEVFSDFLCPSRKSRIRVVCTYDLLVCAVNERYDNRSASKC